MKGQLEFDECMNIVEKPPLPIEIQTLDNEIRRISMEDPCYYCLCMSCVYNVENINVRHDEVIDKDNPCFDCDYCKKYDGNNENKSMEKETCERYLIDNYHAECNRKKFRVLRGNNSML